MKKILIIASLFFSFSLFSQFQRTGILVSTGLSFSKIEKFTPLNPVFKNITNQPPNQRLLTAYNVSPEISYVVNSRFMIGLGYSIIQSKRESNALSGSSSTNGIVTSITRSISTTENKQSGLSLHMRYSQNILSKFIFSVKLTYNNWKGESKFENQTIITPVTNPRPPFLGISTFSFGEVRFSPSLHYFISKGFGCYVETLGLGLEFNDSRAKTKDINYNFDLDAQNWRIGFFYFIPTQKASE
jgi:hypothetical protein